MIGNNLIFLDVPTGFSDSIHSSKMLRSSELYRKCEETEILQKPEKIIDGFRARPIISEDGAYPPISWLVKPYQSNLRLNNSQTKFNKSLSHARVAIERAFRLLMGLKRLVLKLKTSLILYLAVL